MSLGGLEKFNQNQFNQEKRGFPEKVRVLRQTFGFQ